MQIPISEAKGQLTELARRAELGDEVILTRHGRAVVRLVPVEPAIGSNERLELLTSLQVSARASVGVSAARSQDFLYDPEGLPE